MVVGNLTHVQKVRLLYKSCLKLHRGLPLHLKAIGDTYVRDEFKRHIKADQQQVQLFMEAWAVRVHKPQFITYLGTLEIRHRPLQAAGIEGGQDRREDRHSAG